MTSFNLEWGQCKRGRSYIEEWVGKEDWATKLSLKYAVAGTSILSLRLPPHERIQWLESGLRAVDLLGDQKLEAEIWGQLGMANDALGKWKVSVGLYRECLKIARILKDKEREGRTMGSLGLVYIMLGDKHEAKFSLEKALVIAREIGDHQAGGRHLGSLGLISEGKERIEYFDQALEIARAVGDRQGEISHLGCLGMAWFDKGLNTKNIPPGEWIHPNIIMRNTRPDGSLPKDLKDKMEEQSPYLCYQKSATYFEQAVKIAREIGDYPAEGRHLGELGSALTKQGEINRAVACYEQALGISQEIGDRQNEMRQLENLKSAYKSLNNEKSIYRIEKRLKEISKESGKPVTENILEKFGSKEVDPFYEDYWKASKEEDNKNYWSDYYRANIGG